jgi:hypothetical protein
MWERGCFRTTILAQPRRPCRPRHPYAVPRTSLRCVCTRRRNCIEQLSTSPEYAPLTARLPVCKPATIKLPNRQSWRLLRRCIWRGLSVCAQGLCGLSESLLGLDRKADGDLCRPVENLNEMTAKHAMEFALDSAAGTQLQAAIAGMAVRTDDIRFFHRSNMGPRHRFSSQDHCHNQQVDGSVGRFEKRARTD